MVDEGEAPLPWCTDWLGRMHLYGGGGNSTSKSSQQSWSQSLRRLTRTSHLLRARHSASFTVLLLFNVGNSQVGIIITPILQMYNLRHKEVNQLA